MTESVRTPLDISLETAFADPSTRLRFFRDFCEGEVFAVLMNHLPGGKTIVQPGTPILLLEAEFNGRRYVTAFTSLEKLQSFVKQDVKYISLKGVDLMRMVTDLEVILNPGARQGKIFTRDEMNCMADGSMFPSLPPKPPGFFHKWFGRK